MNFEDKKDEIVKWIQSHQPVVYWDRNDRLSSESITKLFASETGIEDVMNHIYDLNSDLDLLLERDTIKDCFVHFFPEARFDTEDNEQQSFIEFCQERICIDFNLKQLFRNSGQQVMFYDTGLEVRGYGRKNAEIKSDIAKIRRRLKITDKSQDEKLRELTLNASYGGNLVIYFMVELIDYKKFETCKAIRFEKANVAIIDTSGGSGHDVFLDLDCALPFDRSRLFYDRSIKYNYSFAVCGMTEDWCEDTDYELLETPVRAKIKGTNTLQQIRYDNARYDEIFRSGKCSLGDMDINRHRGVTYINDFPCGNKCPNCGTFWID